METNLDEKIKQAVGLYYSNVYKKMHSDEENQDSSIDMMGKFVDYAKLVEAVRAAKFEDEQFRCEGACAKIIKTMYRKEVETLQGFFVVNEDNSAVVKIVSALVKCLNLKKKDGTLVTYKDLGLFDDERGTKKYLWSQKKALLTGGTRRNTAQQRNFTRRSSSFSSLSYDSFKKENGLF
jgi:hypothetical protein